MKIILFVAFSLLASPFANAERDKCNWGARARYHTCENQRYIGGTPRCHGIGQTEYMFCHVEFMQNPEACKKNMITAATAACRAQVTSATKPPEQNEPKRPPNEKSSKIAPTKVTPDYKAQQKPDASGVK